MNIDEAIKLINYAAERAYCRYITVGFGMTMMYQEKAEEAADFVAADYPKNISGYPLIKAERDATGKTSKEIADNIIIKKSIWITVAAKVEKTRLTSITKIKNGVNGISKETKKAISALDKI